ncbi:dihydroorotase [Crocinitomix catalasitica]|uniref:dihydroorotase n=1 Tax=Crocinitomix catalasitica TaxID=184607 RepID=UPI000484B948|nr:dihydroorotase [Crocinitomix catalasitica]
MAKILLKNATIVNEGEKFTSDVLIVGERIEKIAKNISDDQAEIIDLKGKLLIPGMIDDQVHFREPGLTHKGNIFTESRAAVAGGITSFMEMPNTNPNAVTQEILADKYTIASKTSIANYSFFMGATNDNIEEVLKTDSKNVCGIKVFMGSSTGNMLVDNEETLTGIFSKCDMLIATHCEDEATIRKNLADYEAKYGEDMPIKYHPEIRSDKACYLSSSMAANLAKKYDTRLHILHLSSAMEMDLFRNDIPLEEKKITAEACIHHLWFSDADYEEKGTLIKWNPAVKKQSDQDAIWAELNDDRIDILATDHAPHTIEEKQNNYFNAPSGGPLVQHAVLAILEKVKEGKISLEKAVSKMSHAPAVCFKLNDRGYIREGYYADLVVVDEAKPYHVDKSNILYKCGWSPFEGFTFSNSIDKTFVNGQLVYSNGQVNEGTNGLRMTFQGY